MAQILISSADPLQAEQWKIALTPEHKILMVSDLQHINEHLSHAAILVVDANLLESGISPLIELIEHQLKILIIGSHWSDQQQIDALILGCAGYFETVAADKLLLKAINRLLKGDIWIQRHLVPHVIRALSELNQNLQTQQARHSNNSKKLTLLSNRELEVANLIKTGGNNKEIARQLNISERTVKAHLTSIFNKLEIHDRLHLALFLKEATPSA